jgi:hypothetical protein
MQLIDGDSMIKEGLLILINGELSRITIDERIGLEGFESFVCVLLFFEYNDGFLVRSPDIPLEIDEIFSLYCFNGFAHGDGFDVKGSVKVLDFIVVTEKSVVIFLGIKLNNCGF